MNVHDSEKIAGVLERRGYSKTDHPGEADLIIFNTCSIRQKAEQKFYSELGRMKSSKRKRQELRIAVAGCIAQQQGDNLFKRAPHIDFVFGPQNIHMLEDIDRIPSGRAALEDNPAIALENLPACRNNGLRAWVTVMYGCNNYCSYCIVPYTRGRERSRPSENVYREVCRIAEEGCKEITLLGQNVNSYKSDTDFPGLLRKLNTIRGIERIRFVTSHPKDLSEDLIIAMAELPKVCEHIHLPLQSGSDNILKRMNRGYRCDDYINKVTELRERVLGICITTDIIAGFPGETDRDHMCTINALGEIEFDGIFAFNFSPRPFTKAADMQNQIPENIKLERLNDILRLQDEITVRKNKSLEGTFQEVLVEGVSDTDSAKMSGRTRTNKIVNFQGAKIDTGSIMQVGITKGRKHSLEGIRVR